MDKGYTYHDLKGAITDIIDGENTRYTINDINDKILKAHYNGDITDQQNDELLTYLIGASLHLKEKKK